MREHGGTTMSHIQASSGLLIDDQYTNPIPDTSE